MLHELYYTRMHNCSSRLFKLGKSVRSRVSTTRSFSLIGADSLTDFVQSVILEVKLNTLVKYELHVSVGKERTKCRRNWL